MAIKKYQFLGGPMHGVIHQKAQRVDMTKTRGIIFNRPDRFVVNTALGQVEIALGDWVLECSSEALYVIRNRDIADFDKPQSKWWSEYFKPGSLFRNIYETLVS